MVQITKTLTLLSLVFYRLSLGNDDGFDEERKVDVDGSTGYDDPYGEEYGGGGGYGGEGYGGGGYGGGNGGISVKELESLDSINNFILVILGILNLLSKY